MRVILCWVFEAMIPRLLCVLLSSGRLRLKELGTTSLLGSVGYSKIFRRCSRVPTTRPVLELVRSASIVILGCCLSRGWSGLRESLGLLLRPYCRSVPLRLRMQMLRRFRVQIVVFCVLDPEGYVSTKRRSTSLLIPSPVASRSARTAMPSSAVVILWSNTFVFSVALFSQTVLRSRLCHQQQQIAMFGTPGRPTRKAADDPSGRKAKDLKKGGAEGEGEAGLEDGKEKGKDGAAGGRKRVQELQLMEAMATLTLQLDEERAIQSRAQNFVLEGPSNNDFLKVMDWTIEKYDQSGVEARKAAKDKQEDFMGNPFGKKPVALFSGMLFRLGGLAEKPESRTAIMEAIKARTQKKEMADNAPAAANTLLDQYVVVGKQASSLPPKFRASRCFKIEYTRSDEDGLQDDVAMTKWIFAIPSSREIEALLSQAREAQLFRGVGLELDFDHGPKSKAAKNVAKIALGSDRAKGSGKGKGGLFSKKSSA